MVDGSGRARPRHQLAVKTSLSFPSFQSFGATLSEIYDRSNVLQDAICMPFFLAFISTCLLIGIVHRLLYDRSTRKFTLC
jgi:hypothetical protein